MMKITGMRLAVDGISCYFSKNYFSVLEDPIISIQIRSSLIHTVYFYHSKRQIATHTSVLLSIEPKKFSFYAFMIM